MSSNDDGGSKLGPNPRTAGDYEVGYVRPPREHQFKKSEASRNPKGRPRNTKGPVLDLVAALLQPVTIRMQGKERKVPYMEAMIQVTKNKALKGNLRAAQMLGALMRELDFLKPQEAFGPPAIREIRSTSDETAFEMSRSLNGARQ
jgi:Family of unknown function (DUF5681)